MFSRPLWAAVVVSLSLGMGAAQAQYVVTNTSDSAAVAGSLANALLQANATGGTITFDPSLAGQTITVSADALLVIAAAPIAIDGSAAPGLTLSGGNANRVFFVQSGSLAINNLTIANGLAQGGNGGLGGGGGGGGMGAGGAIYAASGTSVSVSNVAFNGNAARGGQGTGFLPGGYSLAGGGGGGGFGGAGVDGAYPTASGGAGGSGGGAVVGSTAGNGGGGAGGFHQGGGGGNSALPITAGGNGGYGGGGGGGGYGAQGGAGGFGGGGGGQGAQGQNTSSGGLGGVGGGNGADCQTIFCSGGAGGGGAGFGGAIFTESGVNITIGIGNTFTNGSATGGSGGVPAYQGTTSAGAGVGADLFLSSNTTLTLTEGTFSGIGDDSITSVAAGQGYGAGCATGPGCGASVVVGNNGNVTFSGPNTYAGGTTVLDGGTLTLGHSNALGSGTLTMGQVFTDHTTLVLAGNGLNISNTMVFNSDPVITVTTGNTNTLSGDISGGGDIVLNGGGTLVLSGNNTYTAGTTICGIDCGTPSASSTLRVGIDSVGAPGAITSSAIGTGTLTFDGGILQAGGNFSIFNDTRINVAGATIDANGFTFTHGGTIADSPGHIGSLTITNSAGGTGVVVLSGNNSYSGGTLVTNGATAEVTNNNSVGTGAVMLDGGTFRSGAANLSFANNFFVGSAGGTIDNGNRRLTLSGVIADGGGAAQLQLIGGTGGKTILAGNNTYSGGTLVVGTTVQVRTDTAVGTGTVTLQNALFQSGAATLHIANNFAINNTPDGSAIDNNNRVLTISGNITDGNGPGKLDFVDSGGAAFHPNARTVLLGQNTYTGGTTICACTTVQLGNNSTSASMVGNITNEGAFNVVNANTSGFLQLVNRNGGVTTFSRTTTASTAEITNRTGGSTIFENQSSADRAKITNNNGGTVFANRSSAGSATITNNTQGFTMFGTPLGNDTATAGNATIVNNNNSLTSFNANTTAGDARITTNSGGRTIFYDNSTGGNAQFITNGTGFTDFGGSLGTGSITAGSIAGSGFYYIGGGKTLTTGGNNLSTTVSGVIADFDPCGCGPLGAGNLEKVGAGTMILSGANTYTGTTTVIGGALQADGSIASSSQTTVKTNAALTGIGTVGNTTIESGGILLPGSGVAGTSLNVAGNLAFQSGALYLVTLNSTTASFANVTGTADLAGQVGASMIPGSTVKSKYTILTAAGGRNGTFAGVDTLGLPSGLVASLSYDANNVYLNFALNFAARSNLNINQTNVANALTNFFNANGGISAAFAGLSPNGLSQVSGETATGTQQATFTAMNLFLGLLTDPFIDGRGGSLGGTTSATPFADSEAVAYAAKKSASPRDAFAKFPAKAAVARNDLFDNRWSIWGAAYGGGADTNGDPNVLGSQNATARAFGFAVGADYRLSPATLAGFALAGGGTNFSVNGFGTGRSDLFQAGAFIRHNVGAAYFTGALAYGWQDVTTDRTVTAAGIERLRAQFNANSFAGRFEAGYRYATPALGITPYAAGQFTTYYLPSYAEQVLSGAGNFALNYAAKDVTASRTELGVRFDRSFAVATALVTLRGRLAWAHDFNTDRSITPVFQTLPGTAFVVNGARQAPNSALTTAAADFKWTNGWSASAVFEGEFSDISRSYAGKGVLRYAW